MVVHRKRHDLDLYNGLRSNTPIERQYGIFSFIVKVICASFAIVYELFAVEISMTLTFRMSQG